jgi:hypothetical protein
MSSSLLVSAMLLSTLPAGSPEQTRGQLDAAVAAAWKSRRLTPAEPASDAAFVRRVWLDLAGRVPPADQARRFHANQNPDKRERLVNELLAGPEFADHWGRTWTQRLTGKRPLPQEKYDGRVLHAYLRESLAANKTWRQVAIELVTGDGLHDSSGPASFLLRYRARPADLSGAVSRHFLGISLQCAQCHDHPFAPWKQDDFWGMAAFFSRLKLLESEDDYVAVLESSRGELQIPDPQAKPDKEGKDRKRTVYPRLPGQAGRPAVPRKKAKDQRRQVLAAWITADTNPYFARNTVNRTWEQLFGKPLVKSLDHLEPSPARYSPSEPAASPQAQILDLLAADFVAGGFDLKRLVRQIVLSRPYQLSCRPSADPEQDTAPPLGRFPTRPVSVDQLHESIAQATGYRPPKEPPSDKEENNEEEAPDTPVEVLAEHALTVQRALALLGSEHVHQAVQAGAKKACAIHGRRPGRAHVEWLFLATLSRLPSADELAVMLRLVQKGEEASGLEDVLWALLSSAEFNTNH